jgi:DNA-directed RNA polymerase specialized sigma24 family protein
MSQQRRRRRQFEGMVGRYIPFLARSAQALAAGDRDLQDDLVQEGLVALWRIDPAQLRAAQFPKRLVQTILLNAQLMFLRRQVRHARHRAPLAPGGA